jgi:deoxyuridine 5'-triphosphate nucleotidohydrolase
MKYFKCRKVKNPVRGTEYSAGIDFFVPEDLTIDILKNKNPNARFLLIDNKIILDPHEGLLIPSGLHVKFKNGYVLILCNKSGIASKKRLDSVGNIIDSDYQGEFHFHVVNTTDQSINIPLGEKLLQGLLMPISLEHTEEIKSLEELYPMSTSRGENGFGSTGK